MNEYHRFLQFLILDLHKSDVGPSIFFSIFLQFFFSKINLLFKNKKQILISVGLLTPLHQG